MFEGRTITIASMHKKELVIAPFLHAELGLHAIVANIDTDTLGTFTGEVERTLSPLDAARKKCELAMKVTDCDLAIASEGSFGPHPHLYFVPGNEELVLLVDKKNNCEFYGSHLSTETNFAGTTIHNTAELDQFLNQVGFPSHGVILKNEEHGFTLVQKDFKSSEEVQTAALSLIETQGHAWIETDMRAMNNPTRMKVIEQAVQNLVQKIKSPCPKCEFPGFWITEAITGLECSLCGAPTKSTKAHKYECKKCNYSHLKNFPYNKLHEDPMYCDNCNP